MAKIDLEYILNLSDEDLYKLNRQQLKYRLKIANRIAEDRRASALDYLKNHPDVPTPLVYKNYTKYVRPKHGAIDWKNYDFDFENGESMESLQHKLIKTRAFLSTKTSTIEGWREVLLDTASKLSETTGLEVEWNDRMYKRMWRVLRRLQESKKWTGTDYQTADGNFDSDGAARDLYREMMSHKDMGVDRLTEYFTTIMVGDTPKTEAIDSKEQSEIDKRLEELYETTFSGLGRQG